MWANLPTQQNTGRQAGTYTIAKSKEEKEIEGKKIADCKYLVPGWNTPKEIHRYRKGRQEGAEKKKTARHHHQHTGLRNGLLNQDDRTGAGRGGTLMINSCSTAGTLRILDAHLLYACESFLTTDDRERDRERDR